MLPKNPITSPGVIAGIFAFELLYGLVLAGVMSTMEAAQAIESSRESPTVQVAVNTKSSESSSTKER